LPPLDENTRSKDAIHQWQTVDFTGWNHFPAGAEAVPPIVGNMLYTPAMATSSAVDHHETHFQSGDIVRDIVIGMSDGLTVPFALAAGLSGAVNSLHIIVLAGVAEIAAGAIAMGLGGYLAARGDAEHYRSERLREEREVVERRRDEEEEIYEIFDAYGVERHEAKPVLSALQRNPTAWVDFMMRFELGLEEPQAGRALQSALTIAGSYILGGLVPLLPYMLGTTRTALPASVGITLLALLLFGAIKGRVTGAGTVRSGLQTVIIGGLAAAAAFGLAHLLSAR
jgi:VIT1/CCC1 family predicted Fe2+/Mn2+ transporter